MSPRTPSTIENPYFAGEKGVGGAVEDVDVN
jgi:hypothetical protein